MCDISGTYFWNVPCQRVHKIVSISFFFISVCLFFFFFRLSFFLFSLRISQCFQSRRLWDNKNRDWSNFSNSFANTRLPGIFFSTILFRNYCSDNSFFFQPVFADRLHLSLRIYIRLSCHVRIEHVVINCSSVQLTKKKKQFPRQ